MENRQIWVFVPWQESDGCGTIVQNYKCVFWYRSAERGGAGLGNRALFPPLTGDANRPVCQKCAGICAESE